MGSGRTGASGYLQFGVQWLLAVEFAVLGLGDWWSLQSWASETGGACSPGLGGLVESAVLGLGTGCLPVPFCTPLPRPGLVLGAVDSSILREPCAV